VPGADGHRAALRDRARGRAGAVAALARTDTGRAAGLGVAMVANNAIAVLTTVAFAHFLDPAGYGELGAMLAAFIILMIPGLALQAAVARDVSARLATGHEAPGAGVRGWIVRLTVALAVVIAIAAALREPIAALIGVDFVWVAAAILPAAWLWLVLSVQRGALQGLHRYRAVGLSLVGEAGARLVSGLALVIAGAGVTGAFLATPVSLVVTSLALALPLHRGLVATGERAAVPDVPHLRDLFMRARVPILAFLFIGVLQHGDVILVKRMADPEVAGAYVATSVAAKAIIWVGIALGMYVLPEAVRRTRTGADPRPVLLKAVGLAALAGLPIVLIFAVAGRPLIDAVFDGLTQAVDALPILAGAMTLLACGYLSVQYLLALHRWRFVGCWPQRPWSRSPSSPRWAATWSRSRWCCWGSRRCWPGCCSRSRTAARGAGIPARARS
jgi:O-antigen/teichoic acid export membrane protein